MSDMQDQAAQDSLLKTAASESDSQASSAAQSLSHNSADQSMQPLLRSPCRTLLSNLRGERPNPQQHYKVGIYIRYFNQTKHVDYLDYHVKQYQDTMALCPNWELIDFYIDEGATAPNMESAPEWCRLLQDCFRGKVNLIITQKVSNVSKKDYEITFLARILAALAKPVGIYFVSEDIFTMASCYQDSVFVPNVHFEKIPIKNLVSNQKYQRNLSKAHIANAAANFDPYQINPVKVSRRDGVNYVFNGQHTIEIVALVSGSRDTPVWCMIYDELVYEHEADIFANQQKFVKRLSPYEVFTANLEAGNDDQLIIRDLLESYGLSLGTRKAPCVICAVTTLEQIYQTHGYHMLSRVLRLCAGTWEGDENSFSANILNGITRLVYTFGNQLNDEVFKERVGALSIKQLVRMSKERCPGSMGYAEAMLLEYNGKKKNISQRLSMNKLHMQGTAGLCSLLSDVDTSSEAATAEGVSE